MLTRITALAAGIVFLMATAGFVLAGQSKSQETANTRQDATRTRSQFQKQIQVDKNCEGPQIKTRTRTRTNYLK